MTTMTKKRWLIAGCSLALVLGLVVLVFSLGGSDPRPGATLASGADGSTRGEEGSSSDPSDPDSPAGGASSTDDGRERSDSDADTDGDDGDGGSSSKPGGSSGSNPDSDPDSGDNSGDDDPAQIDDDGDGILDEVNDVVDDVTGDGVDEILCTAEERAAISSTADEMKDDIFAAAEAEKDDLLDSLGLGGLLGGITNAIQQQLNAIDAEAQQAADEVDSLVDDAIDLCEAGGEPLAVFD
jgi:hypothetical protein